MFLSFSVLEESVCPVIFILPKFFKDIFVVIKTKKLCNLQSWDLKVDMKPKNLTMMTITES